MLNNSGKGGMEEKVQKQCQERQRRRRERAKKMRNEISKASADSDEEMPIIRRKPPRPKKRHREPVFEEDIIDGFAVMAFRSFEDLERCVRSAEKSNSRILDPYSNWVKCEKANKRSSLPKVNDKTAVGSRYSIEEEGYICDRESAADKVSDLDDSLFYSSGIDMADKVHVSALSRSNTLVENQQITIPSALPANLPISLRSDNPATVRTDSFYTNPVTTVAISSVTTTTSTTDCPKITIKEEAGFNCQLPNLFPQKPDISSEIYDDKKIALYPEQKYSPLDQKPNLVDTKPTLFSPMNPCPKSTYNNSLFRPHFNTITNSIPAPTNSAVTTITSTTTSNIVCAVVQPTVHTSHSGSSTQSTVSNKSKFSVSSLVSGTNSTRSDYIGIRGPSGDRTEHSSVIRPQIVKSYPSKSPIHLPVSKVPSSNPQNINKSPQLPIKSPLSFAANSNSSFVSHSSAYELSPSLVPTSAQYSLLPHAKPPPISTYPTSHQAVKLEPGVKLSEKMTQKSTPPHIFGPSMGVSHPSTFGGFPNPTHPAILKSEASFGIIGKREPNSDTPPRPNTPQSNFPIRYSHRSQDSHHSLFNSPTNLGGSRLSTFPRPVAPTGFPLPAPISAPLPPSGMFAHHPSSQPLAAPPILTSENSLGQDPLGVQSDLLRRELDSRFLATQDRSGVGISTSGLGTIGSVPTLLRTDVHHHQHQHTHVHQHLLPQLQPPPIVPAPAPSSIFSHSAATPSLFKEVSKVGMESGLYHQRSGLAFSSALSPMMPPNNTTPLVSSQMAPVSKKSGRWNVMHVRIAWEIFYEQQRLAAAKGMKIAPSDMSRTGPGIPGTPSLYSNLSRPNDPLGSMLAPGGSSHRIEGSSFLGVPHIAASVPGFRYAAATPPHNSQFPSLNITPTNIPGPPPGSMFVRESAPSTVPLAAPVHDPWRIRAPIPFGNSNRPWQQKADGAYFENERREQKEREEQQRRKEQKEREEQQRRKEQERREREEKEKREERERRDREEKQRERDKRAEHEKDRLARFDPYNERSVRRAESRSPLRLPLDAKDCHLTGVLSQHMKLDSRSCSSSKYDSSKDEITIVGSKEGTRLAHPPANLLGPPVLPSPSSFLGAHSLSSSMERSRLLNSGYQIGPGNSPAAHWPDPLRDPYRTPMVSTQDQFAAARAHDMVARESYLSAREHLLRDPLRDSLDRAREEHLMRVNPLGTMILNERYREHQAAQEMIERERQYVAAATSSLPGGLYSHPGMMPPHPATSASLLPPTLKTASPLGLPQIIANPSLHHQHMAGLYPTTHFGHHPLPPGMPPPLVHSLAMPGQALLRPPDKKELPK